MLCFWIFFSIFVRTTTLTTHILGWELFYSFDPGTENELAGDKPWNPAYNLTYMKISIVYLAPFVSWTVIQSNIEEEFQAILATGYAG